MLILLFSIYALIVLIELANAYRLKTLAGFRDKNMLWFFLSVCFLLINSTVSQTEILKDAVFSMIVATVLSIVTIFSLTGYLLFRGIFVLFAISGEGKQHPTCLRIKKLTSRPLHIYCFITGITLLMHAGRIFAIWACWNMGR